MRTSLTWEGGGVGDLVASQRQLRACEHGGV